MKYWKEYPEFAESEYFPSFGVDLDKKRSKGFDINEDQLWIVFQHFQQQQLNQQQQEHNQRGNGTPEASNDELEKERDAEKMIRQKLRDAAVDFLRKFAADVHDIVCNPTRVSEASKLTRKGVAPGMASLASLVMLKLGYPEPLAIGFATYLFMVISEASRTAFCSDYKKV